jgi:uncharacterized membrane protein YbhN (UPF0104 family)
VTKHPAMFRLLALMAVVAIAGIAGWSLWHQLAGLDLVAVRAALASVRSGAMVIAALALGVSALGYAGLERVAGSSVGLPQPFGRSLVLAITTQGISLATGKGLLVAGAIRYRLFRRWGGNLVQAVTATLLVSLHGNAGMLALCGIVGAIWGPWAWWWWRLALITSAVIGLGLWCWLCARQQPFTWQERVFSPPSLSAALCGVACGGVEKLACGLLAWIVLPGDPGITCGTFLAVMLVALFLARISQVPGGLGVLEATVIGLWPVPLAGFQAELVAGLLAFRCAYYLVPLVPGLLLLAFFGWWRKVPPCAIASA